MGEFLAGVVAVGSGLFGFYKWNKSVITKRTLRDRIVSAFIRNGGATVERLSGYGLAVRTTPDDDRDFLTAVENLQNSELACVKLDELIADVKVDLTDLHAAIAIQYENMSSMKNRYDVVEAFTTFKESYEAIVMWLSLGGYIPSERTPSSVEVPIPRSLKKSRRRKFPTDP